MSELISIVITSYNYSKYIAEAIESVLEQTYKNWELIIVDDASTDNSVEIINSYVSKDSRIKLVINKKNLGLSKTLQKGIQNCNGKWVAFLESDDKFATNSLEEKLKATKLGADIIYSDLQMIGDAEVQKKYIWHFSEINRLFGQFNQSQFISDFKKIIAQVNIIPTFSVAMVKKDILLNCDFNPSWKAALDHHIWAQLSDKKIYYINQKLSFWRIHSDSYINKCQPHTLKKELFAIQIYAKTIQKEPFLTKALKLFTHIRKKIIYITIKERYIKISLFKNLFVKEFKF